MPAIASRERPILFSDLMVRAIQKDRKSMTRRVVLPQPPAVAEVWKKSGSGYCFYSSPARGDQLFRVSGPVWAVRELYPDYANKGVRCPYGVVGDRLWVRESFLPCRGSSELTSVRNASYVCFRDGGQKFRSGHYHPQPASIGEPRAGAWPTGAKWRPSIHLPRWASRLTLEITSVRLEELHAMNFDDAVAEGLEGDGITEFDWVGTVAREWDKINGRRYPWASNPWVWVIGFKVQNSAPTRR